MNIDTKIWTIHALQADLLALIIPYGGHFEPFVIIILLDFILY